MINTIFVTIIIVMFVNSLEEFSIFLGVQKCGGRKKGLVPHFSKNTFLLKFSSWDNGTSPRVGVGSKWRLIISPILRHPTWTRPEIFNEEHDTVSRKSELLVGISGGFFFCHKTRGYRKKSARHEVILATSSLATSKSIETPSSLSSRRRACATRFAPIYPFSFPN